MYLVAEQVSVCTAEDQANCGAVEMICLRILGGGELYQEVLSKALGAVNSE